MRSLLSLFSSFYPKIKRLRRFKIEGIGNKPEAAEVLSKGCEALEKMGIHYWVASGTLLGLHRQNGFIPHDTDIDVEVLTDQSVKEIIAGIPFDPIQIMTRRGKPMQIAFLADNNIIFDIYFFHDYGPKVLNFNEWGIFYYPKDLISTLSSITFKEKKYPCPNPEDYCVFRYGAEWRTPKKSKGVWAYNAPNLIRYMNFKQINSLKAELGSI